METALQGVLVLDKSGRLEWGDNILRTLQVYHQHHCDILAGLWSRSRHLGFETSRLGLVSRKIVNVSVSAIYVSCPRLCINSFLMGMQMAPYAL